MWILITGNPGWQVRKLVWSTVVFNKLYVNTLLECSLLENRVMFWCIMCGLCVHQLELILWANSANADALRGLDTKWNRKWTVRKERNDCVFSGMCRVERTWSCQWRSSRRCFSSALGGGSFAFCYCKQKMPKEKQMDCLHEWCPLSNFASPFWAIRSIPSSRALSLRENPTGQGLTQPENRAVAQWQHLGTQALENKVARVWFLMSILWVHHDSRIFSTGVK
jgi:hypothetical protein